MDNQELIKVVVNPTETELFKLFIAIGARFDIFNRYNRLL
jgi:hypothetical protein